MGRTVLDMLGLCARVLARPAPAGLMLCGLVLVAAIGMGVRPAAARMVCLDDAEQSKLVAKNEIVPVTAALNKRKVQKRGKLVEATICHNQKGFFYRMTMESAAGDIKVVRVAAAPSPALSDLRLKRGCYYDGRSWSTGSICRLECSGDACPRQYCRANGEWQGLSQCTATGCQPYRSC